MAALTITMPGDATECIATYELKAEIVGKVPIIQLAMEKLREEQALEGLPRSAAADMNLAELTVLPMAAVVVNITETVVLPMATAAMTPAGGKRPIRELAAVVSKPPPRWARLPLIGALRVLWEPETQEAG